MADQLQPRRPPGARDGRGHVVKAIAYNGMSNGNGKRPH
jgi:hypothetical protein